MFELLPARFRSLFFVLLATLCLPLFAGCPDYSHQREVPDYGSMTDDGGNEASEEDSE